MRPTLCERYVDECGTGKNDFPDWPNKVMVNLVSVVITTYNRQEKLINAVTSVMSQDYEPIEVIVVDDGSEKPVEPLIKEMFGSKVCCITHQKNTGAPTARNTGIKHSKGEFIAFLDDDDIWASDKLSKQVNLFKKCDQSVGLVYSGFSYVNEGVEFVRALPKLRGNVFTPLLKNNFIGSCSIPLVRRKVYEEVGLFDKSFKSFQDWDMWLRILSVFKTDFVNEVLVVREAHGEQITSDIHKKILGRELILKKYNKFYLGQKKHLTHQYRALSDNFFIIGNNRKGLEYSFKAVKADMVSYVNIANFILSLFPEKMRKQIIIQKKTQSIGNVRFYR